MCLWAGEIPHQSLPSLRFTCLCIFPTLSYVFKVGFLIYVSVLLLTQNDVRTTLKSQFFSHNSSLVFPY